MKKLHLLQLSQQSLTSERPMKKPAVKWTDETTSTNTRRCGMNIYPVHDMTNHQHDLITWPSHTSTSSVSSCILPAAAVTSLNRTMFWGLRAVLPLLLVQKQCSSLFYCRRHMPRHFWHCIHSTFVTWAVQWVSEQVSQHGFNDQLNTW